MMKIYFERSGGFAGLIMTADIDLDDMPAEEAASLHKLIDDADLFHLEEPAEAQGYPDGFHYILTIILDDEEQRTFEFSEGYIPGDLVPLINDLSLRARYKRRS